MAHVYLEIEDPEWNTDDVAAELREVANRIEDGYAGGLTFSGNNWELADFNW